MKGKNAKGQNNKGWLFIMKLERFARGRVLVSLWYWLLGLFSECKECYDGLFYPSYGTAPHVHDFSKTGSFIGSTVILPKEKWPENYEPDLYYNGESGTYWCPNKNCRESKENSIKRREDFWKRHKERRQ